MSATTAAFDHQAYYNNLIQPTTTTATPTSQSDAPSILSGCASVHLYERLATIDEGTYGIVYKARHKDTGEIVALKKVKLEVYNAGNTSSTRGVHQFPITALREINLLLTLPPHTNVLHVHSVVTDPHSTTGGIYMVMQYCYHDLRYLLNEHGKSQQRFKQQQLQQPQQASLFSQSSSTPTVQLHLPEIKRLLYQIISGVAHLHAHYIVHRDIKTSNILLLSDSTCVIADFGMARLYTDPLQPMTPLVQTLWYRAPEVLLRADGQYSEAVDLFSVGCVFGELLLVGSADAPLKNRTLFNGEGEFQQLMQMFELLGTPTDDEWPEWRQLPLAKSYVIKPQSSKLRQKFPRHSHLASQLTLSDNGFDLLSRMLAWNPAKRITAADALQHPWFKESPPMQNPSQMPTFRERDQFHNTIASKSNASSASSSFVSD